MLNFIDNFFKKVNIKNKNIIIDSNDKGTITMKFEILHFILEYILQDYNIFNDADIEFDEVNKEKNLYRLFIVVNGSLKSMSENKLSIIKKKIMHAFQKNGFNLINVIITSEEKLEE